MSTPPSLDPEEYAAPSGKTSDRLKTVVGDGSFERLMKERARIRKEKDEHSIAELRVQLTSMENALSAEIKRRVDSNRRTERQCRERIAALQKEFDKVLDDRTFTLAARLHALEGQAAGLHARLEEESVVIPADVQDKADELQQTLRSFQDEFTVEKRDRLNREGRILKQLHDYESHVSETLEEARKERHDTVRALEERMETSDRLRKEADDKFRKLVDTELGALKKEIKQEITERKDEDDEIVEALNRYTKNLQSSLSVISSVEE